MYHNSKLFAVLALLSLALSACGGASLYPKSLSTQSGSVSTSNVNSLKTKELTGRDDQWGAYIEFYGTTSAYQGIFVFDVSSVVDSACYYDLIVNYKGPNVTEQVWQWEVLNQATGAWVFAGNNSGTSSWTWTDLTLQGPDPFADFVKDREMQVRYSSKTAFDNSNVDYLELSVTSATSGPTPSAPTSAPPATSAPTSTPTDRATDRPTSRPTQRPTERPTSAPTQRPTSKPTSAPTSKPTSAPTSKPTSKPTSAPTSKPTSAPTSKPTTAPTSKPTTAPTSKPTTPPGKPTNGKLCAAGTHYRPGPGTTWQWQLSGSIDTSKNVQMYDIDMFGASASLIQTLHNAGRAVTCYIDTAYEPGRPDSGSFTSAVLGTGIDGWPGQKWVDIRSSVVRNIMANRMAQAAAKGCDAVEMDDVDAYANSPGFPLTAADQIDFNTFLATTAHANDLGIALKNDLEQVSALASKFDFAINEQCYEYDECSYLNTFVTQGKAVFGVEYELATSAFCSKANTAKFSWLLKGLDLDAAGTQCCPTCSGTYTCVAGNSKRSFEEDEEAILEAEEAIIVEEQPSEQEYDNSAAPVSGVAFIAVIAVFAALM